MNQNYHILIVEDFAPDAELEEREIKDALPQCTFRHVDTHKDFIAALAEFQPDLIVSDYQMPNFDGMSVLRITLEHTPLTPVIIVTGSLNEDTAVACMKAGAVDYVLKDSLKRLGPTVRHALEQKQINLDRQKAQAALIESEERFRLLFETMAQGVVYQDAKGQITTANPAAERILGLTLDQMQGRTSTDPRWRTIHPDGSDFPGNTHPAMIALRTGQEVRNVLMGVWHPAEERHRWIRVSAVPQFRPGDASPYQVYATLSDITELFESEVQIRHLNAVLKAVRNINQLIVREHDHQRLLQAACDSLLETRGFSSAYIVLFDAAHTVAFAAQSGWDAVFPDFLTLLASGDWPYCVRQGMEGTTGALMEETSAICGACPLTFTAEHKQEKKIIAPIKAAGRYQGMLTVALPHDLRVDPDELGLLEEVAGDLAFALRNLEIEDQRQQAEAALRNSRNMLQRVLDAIPSAVFWKDRNSIYLGGNRTWLEAAGLKCSEDVVGKSDYDLPWEKTQADSFREYDRRVLESGIPEYDIIEPYRRADGTLAWARSNKAPLRDAEGNLVGVLGTYEDITERKRAEEELRKYRKHLEELVKERTATLEQEIAVRQRTEQELQQAKELAEQANRAKSDFLANMSHDLRTPLNAILGYAQILQEDDNLTGRQRHGLETIHTSGEHLLALINDILDLSKIEAGRLELDADDIHLPTFLNNIVRMIQVRASQKGIRFVQERDPALPEGIRTDPKRLQEVLLNLLGNAVKFTEHGCVTLRVRSNRFSDLSILAPLQKPTTSDESLTTNLRFEVEDNGLGITPQDLEKIFEPFRQAGEKRTKSGGTGLGLAIGRRLVRMMGSELQVESVPGQGSRFWFEATFPVVPVLAVETTRSFEKMIGYAGPRRTLLIVDDEETNRNLLLNLLFPLGFRIVEAADGQECVEKAPKFKPDLILLDLRMPLVDGFSAIQQLRASEDFREIPIIAVSASVFAETRQRALDIGFNDFLFKPIQIEKLIALLQRHLTLEWVYEEAPEPLPELHPPLPELNLVSALPAQEVEQLYAVARRGNHKKVLEHLAHLEQKNAAFRPLVEKLRALAQRFDTDTIVAILEDMDMK